jgi:hypothetical protein
MPSFNAVLRLLALNLSFAAGLVEQSKEAWKAGKFKTLVTFGDSYTDENRLGYFIQNKGAAPPVGWEQPVVCYQSKPTPLMDWTGQVLTFTGPRNCLGRPLLGALRQHLLGDNPLQLRRLRRRMLQRRDPAPLFCHQRLVPRYCRLRSPRLPRRRKLHVSKRHALLHRDPSLDGLRHLDRHKRPRQQCLSNKLPSRRQNSRRLHGLRLQHRCHAARPRRHTLRPAEPRAAQPPAAVRSPVCRRPQCNAVLPRQRPQPHRHQLPHAADGRGAEPGVCVPLSRRGDGRRHYHCQL